MKKLIVVILMTVISSCQVNNEDIFQEKRIIVSGKIELESNTAPKVVSIIINDIATGKQHTIAETIDSTGEFLIKANLYHPQDIYFKYGRTFKTLLIHPGDSIFMSFNASNLDRTLLYQGDRAETNQQLNDFFDRSSNYFRSNGDVSNKIAKFPPLEYKELVFQQQLKYDSIFNAFKKKIAPNNEVSRWVKNYLRYRCAFDLLQIVNTRDLQIPPEYWEFLDKYPLNNIEALNCSEYVSYLRYFYQGYFIHKQNKLSEAIKEYRAKNYYSYLTIAKDSINQNFNGIAKDLLLSQTFSHALDDDYLAVDSVITNMDHLFESRIFQQLLEKQISKFRSTKKENYEGMNLIENNKNNFLSELILNKYKNKVVYIDVWATWCSPCLSEMSYSKLLHEKLENKDIVFLYLCGRSNKSTWRKVMEEKELEGDHLLLSDDQYSVLSSQYNMQGFPSYLIVNKTGEVINNAPRPSSPKIGNMLNKLLNK